LISISYAASLTSVSTAANSSRFLSISLTLAPTTMPMTSKIKTKTPNPIHNLRAIVVFNRAL